ncbi:MAG TPA: hypothetical protein VIJ51_11170 [Solirubrobacteraceae bacterium]
MRPTFGDRFRGRLSRWEETISGLALLVVILISFTATVSVIQAVHGHWIGDTGGVHRTGAGWVACDIVLAFVLAAVALVSWDGLVGVERRRPPTRSELLARAYAALLALLTINLGIFSVSVFANAAAGTGAFDTARETGVSWIAVDLITGLAFVLGARVAWLAMRDQQRRCLLLVSRHDRAHAVACGLGCEASGERARRRLSPERRAALDKAARLTAEIRASLARLAGEYTRARLSDGPDHSRRAWERLEAIADQSREADELNLDLLYGDDFLLAEELALLGALEDSIVLGRSDEDARRRLRVEPREVIDRMAFVVDWGGYDTAWDESWDAVAAGVRAGATDDVDAGSLDTALAGLIDALEIGRGEQTTRTSLVSARSLKIRRPFRRRQPAASLEGPLDELRQSIVTVHEVYLRLSPDGRAQKAEKQVAAAEALEVEATHLRMLDTLRVQVALDDRELLTTWVAAAYPVRHNLILAISADPRRRARAASPDDLADQLRTRDQKLARLAARRRRRP